MLRQEMPERRMQGSLSNELHPFVLIDMDQPCSPSGENGKRCDYLFFSGYEGKDWVVPMELQKGKASASKIVEQLQAGAVIAEKLVPKGSILNSVPRLPMVVVSAGMS